MSYTFNYLANHPIFKKTLTAEILKDTPLGYIDVGARGGTHEAVEAIASLTAVLGFEPDLEEYNRMLSDDALLNSWAKFALEPIALADTRADATLYLLSASTNHSLLQPNTEFTNRYKMVKWEEVGKCDLKTELMDTILFEKRQAESHWGEMIKLDTQGTEYEILTGSQKMLTERTVALVTEVAFCELYKGQKLFSEIELFLRQFGFSFYGFHTLHSRSLKQLNKLEQTGAERIMYADAVFLKDPLPGSAYKGKLSERQLHVLFVSALLLKYYDFALELATKTWAAHLPEQISLVKELINDLSATPSQTTLHEVLTLAENVKMMPEKANIFAGKFADKRRVFFDYDDVAL